MAEAGECWSVAKVLRTKDLVGEIMLKFGSSKSMLNFSVVTAASRAAQKDPGFSRRFAEGKMPAFVGFLVEFKQILEPKERRLRLLFHEEASQEETAVAQRQQIPLDLLAEDSVLCSAAGCVLTAGPEHDDGSTQYYTSYPSQVPRVYTAVANNMPKIPRNQGQDSKNTYGQFGVMRNEGPSGLSFFVKDWTHLWLFLYGGATISSNDDIYIHVCEHSDGTWNRCVSPPIKSPASALFHRNPYSVLHGNRLFMMYVVGYIDCLDLDSKTFSKVNLPFPVVDNTLSWFDYTVCPHSKAELALVQYRGGNLDTWVLNSAMEGGGWMLEARISLVNSFNPRIPRGIVANMLSREADPLGRDNFYTVQLRSASPDARFGLVTFGFDPNLYMVDMMQRKVFDIPKAISDGQIGKVYALTEVWPPKMG